MSEETASRSPLVLIVPNFSEGRREDVMDAIVEALQVPGVLLANRQADPDHNRLDATLVGSPEAVRRSALAGARKAVELIDMDQHRGSHPRMGAVDVIPFVPARGISMDECIELARSFGRDLAEALDLPVYLYDRAALSPERRSLTDVRRGEYEGLRADVERGARLPDFGPHRIGRAGAVAVGARKPLVAFNVYFAGADEAAAKRVARAVREATGGLANVRAIGFFVPERGCVTVSMNLIDVDATPIYRALELVRVEAARHGLVVTETEIVGLVPAGALVESAGHYLQLAGFDPDRQVLENLVAGAGEPAAGGRGAGAVLQPAGLGSATVEGFVSALSSDAATPGGGSAAAVAGAAGAALIAMVARLTAGRKGFEEVDERMRTVAVDADAARDELLRLADADAAVFDTVMAALRLPKGTDGERAARAMAIQEATAGAAEVPAAVADRAVALMGLAAEVVAVGNPNAASDAASAAHLLAAAAGAALANVEINAAALKDPARAGALRAKAEDLRRERRELLAATEAAFRARLPGS